MDDKHQLVRTIFNPIHPLSEEETDAFAACLNPFEYKRKTLITAVGQVQRSMLIVTEGVQYSWFEKEGRMHVLAFTYPVHVTGIPESFFTQTPAMCNLETVTPSRGYSISWENVQMLNQKFRNIETLNRKMVERVLVGAIHRHYELLSTSAQERFLAFASRSPHLFQLVPHKLIASYLRMDATNFSRFFNELKI